MTSSAALGHPLDDFGGATFLMAKELAADESSPYFEHAKIVEAEFARYLMTGDDCFTFTQFLLPIPETDEEQAHSAKVRDEYLAAVAAKQKS